MGCGASNTTGQPPVETNETETETDDDAQGRGNRNTPGRGANTRVNKGANKGANKGVNKGGAGNQRTESKRNTEPVGNEKGYKKRIRDNLRNASAGNDIPELEKAMQVFENNHMEDGGEYSDAEKRLEFLKLRKEIREACMRRHPVVLDRSIQNVEASPYKRQLQPYLEKAYYLKQHQQELQTEAGETTKFRHDVGGINQETISEVRSYSRPPDGVHPTMVCSYMLLGYPEEHLIDWTNITAMMGGYGKYSLLREVNMADSSKVDDDTAIRASSYLNEYTKDEVQTHSNGAAAFYCWSEEMLGKQNGNADNDGSKNNKKKSLKKLINTVGRGQAPGSRTGSFHYLTQDAAADKGKDDTQDEKEQEDTANHEQDNTANHQQDNTANQQQGNTAKRQQDNTYKQQQDNTYKQQQDNATKQANTANNTRDNVKTNASKTTRKG